MMPTAPSTVEITVEIVRIRSTLMPEPRRSRVGADSRHRGAGLGAKEQLHEEGAEEHEEDLPGREDEELPDPDGQDVVQEVP
jgi:hypothetical protein